MTHEQPGAQPTEAQQAAERARQDEDFNRRVSDEVQRQLQDRHEAEQQAAEQRQQAVQEKAEAWGTKGYDGPQPWELAAELGKDNPDAYQGPGAVTHTEPTLTFGSDGPAVERLVGLLSELGYTDNSYARGENPSRVLDNSVMNDVKRFARDHGVRNDEAEWEGKTVPASTQVDAHVGPYIWQALYDARRRAEDDAGERKAA